MERSDRIVESAAAMLPLSRQLLLAVLLPAVVAVTNQLLFEAASRITEARAVLYPGMAATTAVLSWCIGRYLQPAWLRWLIFAWCLALLNLLTIAACLAGGAAAPPHFLYVLVSAQIGLLILWALLAPVAWQWRVPAAAVAVALIILLEGTFGRSRGLSALMILAAVIVTVLCGVLRWHGFMLRNVNDTATDAPQHPTLHVYQFGVKHMLIWSTAIAPLLLALLAVDSLIRAVDTLLFATGPGHGLLQAVVVSFCLASMILLAIWAILGAAAWPLRLAALLLLPVLTGVGLEPCLWFLVDRFPGGIQAPVYWGFRNSEGGSLGWHWLIAVLLASLLLFVRASGYRLARKAATAPETFSSR